MNTPRRQVRKCPRCGARLPIGSGLAYCETCTYADEVGRDAADRQTKLANAARDRETIERRKVRR